jgi:hypothetical protein
MFLASDASSYVTGHTLFVRPVDKRLTMRRTAAEHRDGVTVRAHGHTVLGEGTMNERRKSPIADRHLQSGQGLFRRHGQIEVLSRHGVCHLFLPPSQFVTLAQSLFPTEAGHDGNNAEIELGLEPRCAVHAVTFEGVTESDDRRLFALGYPGLIEG